MISVPKLKKEFRVWDQFGSQKGEYVHPQMGLGMRLDKGLLRFEPCRKRLPASPRFVRDLDLRAYRTTTFMLVAGIRSSWDAREAGVGR